MFSKRYHLVIQAPDENLAAFFNQFTDRALQPEYPAAAAGGGWCGFHEWQVSTSEIQAWRATQANNPGLWLVLEPRSLFRLADPLAGPQEALVQLQNLSELAEILSQHLRLDSSRFALQLQALLPKDFCGSVREALPLVLSAAGWPEILGAEPPAEAEACFVWPQPLRDIQALAGKLETLALEQPLALSPQDAPLQLFLLAWMASDEVSPLIKLAASGLKLSWPKLANSRLTRQADHWLLSIEPNGTPFGSWGNLLDAWSYLRTQLPSEIPFEILLAPLAYETQEQLRPNPAAIQRYACLLTAETCWLQACAPPQQAGRLQAALDLCRWVIPGGPLQLASSQAIAQFKDFAQKEYCDPGKDYWLNHQQAEVHQRHHRAFIARRLWLESFADLWDLSQSRQRAQQSQEAEDDLMDTGFKLAHGLAQPRSQELLLAGRSGHFWRAELQQLGPLPLQQLSETSSWWQELGFEARAELVWEPAPDVMMQLLTHPQYHCCLVLMLGHFSLTTECISWFGNGVRAFSSNGEELPDFGLLVKRFDWPQQPLPQCLQSHLQQAQAYCLEAQTSILPIPADLSGLLQLIDQNLLLAFQKG